MKLKIDFPKSMITDELLGQKRIPCFCKVSKEFEISFSDTVPESSGVVSGWDRRELELRAVAGAGGRYTHFANGLITLQKIDEDVYKIIDLEMFYRSYGWGTVLRGGGYTPPGDF
ncbi:hypothetical protein, partial [Pseudomonas syringae]|uniref:hypothetical protein n=1 Tax=Pseudomonas syringae TaxID=317 RepID=UPI00145D137B